MLDWTDPYRNMIISSFSSIIASQKVAEFAIPSLCKGVVEIIFGRKRIAFGEGLADNEVDFNEIPAEFHEQDSTFDWQTFTSLYSLKKSSINQFANFDGKNIFIDALNKANNNFGDTLF